MITEHSTFGRRFRLDAGGSLGATLANLLGDLAVPAEAGQHAEIMRVRRHGRSWSATFAEHAFQGPLADIVNELLIALNDFAAQAAAPTHVVLHAATVEVGGNGVALLGRSGAGKSTFAATAVRGGHGFVADEVTAIHPRTLQVAPYHRPIGLRPDSATTLLGRRRLRPAAAFELCSPWRVGGCGALAGPTPLRALVHLQRGNAAQGWRLLTPAEALVQLTTTTLAAAGREVAVFRALERLARTVPSFVWQYREASEAAPQLATLLNDTGAP